ncbi:amidohydrolase family protein [Streptomyces sp. 4F14]|uniref:amidohydrolase family protein n=1 Tax=Streptomyces sp. 4F14 TaxID=3394380 RepID=UPI003A899384
MKTLLTGGTVVSMDPAVGDLSPGDVLIEDGVIVEVAALQDSPGRSVFCLGAGWGTSDPVDSAVRRVRDALPGDGPVTMALGLRGPEATGMDTVARELKLADGLGLRTSLHVDLTAGAVAGLRAHGLLRDTTTFVHGNGLGDEELRMLADAGSSLSISPDVELKMGFGQPMTGRALAAGLRPTLSVDDVPSAAGDLFSTMRTAFAVQRGLDGGLCSRHLLSFVTVDAAASCGLAARAGSITPGKDADLVLLRADDLTVFPVTDPVASVVSAGHPGLVDTVLVAGRVVKRDGALVGVDLPALRARLLASRDRIAAAAGVPLDGTWRPEVLRAQ